jgi:hypothetical protein
MFAQVPPIVIDLGVLLGVFTALVAASQTKPCRYVFGRLVADPVTHWLRREVEDVVAPIRAELTTNGGSSVKDAVTRIEHRIAQADKRFSRIERHVGIKE